MNEVEIITNDSENWVVLKLNGRVYEECHSISVSAWLDLIQRLGNEASFTIVSDEDMAYELH